MNDGVSKVVEAIAADVLKLSQIVFEGKEGINPKTGQNTLKDSALSKQVQVNVRSGGDTIVIETLFDNYIDFIERGRKPKQGKQPPLDALRDWALLRGISTDNSTLFLISRAIWRDGFEGRPVLAALEEEIEKQFDDKWADQLFEVIIEELEKYFE